MRYPSASLNPPRAWSPPRGTGYSIEARRGGFRDPVEEDAVATLAIIVQRLRTAAEDARLRSNAKLATRAGVSVSAVQAFFSGSSWPSFRTLALVADTLGFRVVLDHDDQPWPRRLLGPAEYAHLADRESACASAAERARFWHDAIVVQLHWLRRNRRESLKDAAWRAGTNLHVVADVENSPQTGSWASTQVLLALAYAQHAWLAVDPVRRPYPTPVWALVEVSHPRASSAQPSS